MQTSRKKAGFWRAAAPQRFRGAILGGGALLLASALPVPAQKSLEALAQPGIQDLTASVAVLSKNDRELAKIGKGFVDAYRLDKQEMWAKEPGKFLFQGKQGIFTIRYVTNGGRKLTEVATLRIRKVEDVSKEPGKADSLADLGLITTSFAEQIEASWLRSEARDGKTLQVFQYWFPEDPRSKHTIWVDPATRTMVEHIAHHRNPNRPGFKKKFVFREPKQYGAIWAPT
ncbi:MAG: hypothetical protein FJX77_16530, partial [Armatimonadetes bacterium]|nr:hypothetical protein [Armatimonadota bacterium]